MSMTPEEAEDFRRLLAELIAVRAARDEFKVWADQRHSAALYAEEQNELYHDALDRAERAEATLAAIRARAENAGHGPISGDEVLALLDRADDTPPANNCADG